MTERLEPPPQPTDSRLSRPARSAARAAGVHPDSCRRRLAHLDAKVCAAVQTLLLDDLVTEYDARFLNSHLREIGSHWSPEFWHLERVWALDEERHFEVARDVFEACFGPVDHLLDGRRPDFTSLAPLLRDEFSALCLTAYDELVTVRGYSRYLPLYDLLNGGYGAWMRVVIADEARHYAGFLDLALGGFPERLEEGLECIRGIRSTEGQPYRATFLLDHDDPIYADTLLDDAARSLERQFDRRLGSRAVAGGT